MAEKTAYVRIDGTNVPIKFYDMKDDWIEYDGGQCLSINVDDVIYQAYCNAEPYENISHHLRFIDKDGNERVVYDIKRVSTVTANLIETLSSGASNKTYSFPYGGAIILTGGNATGGANGNNGGTGGTATYYSTASGGSGGRGGAGASGSVIPAGYPTVTNGTWNGMETHGYYYNGEAKTEYYFKSVNDGSDGTPVLTNNDASFIASALTSYRGQCRVYSFDLDT